MAIDTETRASRRNILAAALGALGGAVAAKLGHPDETTAFNGETVLVGGTFSGTSPTSFRNTSASGSSIVGSHAGEGIGLEGQSVTGAGVAGQATDAGIGVSGVSSQGIGVRGVNLQTGPSDFVEASNWTGVMGTVGNLSTAATNTDETGVYGYSDISINSVGVWGDSIQGIGVFGSGDLGVLGYGGVAVRAMGDAIGVETTGTIALQTTGRLVFKGRSGHTYVSSGRYYKDVAIAGMPSSADVIATLRTRKSGYYIAAVVSYAGKFRIYLNKTATSNISFNYLVLN
jgi:hypothetical protein